MRVLYLTNNADRASTTVGTRGWFRFLAPRGLRPVLVSPQAGEFSDWARSLGVPFYRLELPFPRKLWPVPFLRSLWALRRIVKRHNVQLIHCNEEGVYPVGQFLGRVCRIPVVVTIHFPVHRAFCQWAFAGSRAPARLFFVSHRQLEQCRPALTGIVPEGGGIVVHNGLELDNYQPDERLRESFRREHCANYSFVVGAACALRPRKQLEHLIEAFTRLRSPGAGLVLAGFSVPGDEAYAERLIEHARERLGQRFAFIGPLNDLRPFCNGLDLFVNTSREESFGIAALEALACGCPVIGYDSKAVDEVVLPDGGEITPQDDVATLAQRLDAWLADPEKLQRARPAARKQAERFGLESLSQRVWQEYQALVNGREESA